MPQKRMAARGQSAKLAKGPSSKKSPAVKPVGRAKVLAKKTKVAAKSAGPQAQIEKAKAALKKETVATIAVKAKKTSAKGAASASTAVAAPQETPVKAKPEGKRGRKISIDISPNEAASALSGKWNTLFKKAEQIEAKPYNMRNVFEEKTAITHKVLGWGYILANRNDRLEVLFKDGIKYLISNYKP